MSSWGSVLQQLAELDPADFDPLDLADEQLREFVPLAQLGINRLTAAQTRAVAAAEARQVHRADGMVAMKSWLTGHCRISGRAAADLVRDGRRLVELPELAAAYAEGAVTPAHVAVVTAAVTPARLAVADAHGIDLGTTDAVLTEAARALGPEDTAKAARRWVAGIDPDGALDEAAGLPRLFRMAVSAGGRVYLSGHLDPVGGETVHTALEALMNGDRPAHDQRTYGERMGHALVELARQALRAGGLPTVRGAAAQVRVTIDWMALCAERGARGVAGGELAFAGPITPETARRLACDAAVVRMLTDPAGLPIDVGREQRTATAAIRRAVELRDGHCVLSGCAVPAAWCDVHHVIHWAHGGPTSCENGALLCERHHTAVHEGGFGIARDPGTTFWHTYRPDGSEIRIRGSSP
ncbi:HNH endonuclease signature motif containing protein [Blastococcus sp. CT_GayMR16]|uniref:HNH endonuclease signature motif containing protein n=1 Tax=Blastococcus sp. CT_GayMR16 TaxID=2559607 RepID=UPI00142F85B8|nr:HNH endonuclease signature motif containing protein [Blastococcus sp. CT_GayMR16]